MNGTDSRKPLQRGYPVVTPQDGADGWRDGGSTLGPYERSYELRHGYESSASREGAARTRRGAIQQSG